MYNETHNLALLLRDLEGNVVLLSPSGCAFLSLKGYFSPPECPFKAVSEVKFKRLSCNINKMIWPDPHSKSAVSRAATRGQKLIVD